MAIVCGRNCRIQSSELAPSGCKGRNDDQSRRVVFGGSVVCMNKVLSQGMAFALAPAPRWPWPLMVGWHPVCNHSLPPPWELIVIPAKAGIYAWRLLDSRLRGNDDHMGGLNGYPCVGIDDFHDSWQKFLCELLVMFFTFPGVDLYLKDKEILPRNAWFSSLLRLRYKPAQSMLIAKLFSQKLQTVHGNFTTIPFHVL